MRVLLYLTFVLSAIVAANTRALGQQPVSNETLFAQLQADATTDNALKQFLKRTPQDSDAQKYLATHLPEQILQGPQSDHARVWVNEVHLAGAFRIEEAIPALVKWMEQPIGLPEGQTLSSVENLITVPAGRAMAQIGEPAIPALADALKTGNYERRWVACRALNMVGTPRAIRALMDHLGQESDPELKTYIEKVTKGRDAGDPGASPSGSLSSLRSAQEVLDPATLFRQLESRESTDDARETLFLRGVLDSATSKYLRSNLSPMIEKGPKGASHQWRNAAVLAGRLKIVEAAPALAKWIGLDYFGGDFTMAQVERLETNRFR
jgi:HEAT repeat protein